MISRYTLYDIASIRDRYELSQGLPKGVKVHYNISPTMAAPIIVHENGARRAKRMTWGLVANGAKDMNSVFRYKTYNIASEKIFSKHSWERAVRERRCLIPASGFYLLNGNGKKRAFYARQSDAAMLSLAGVYSSWTDQKGVEHYVYSLITIAASTDMPSFAARMPIIIAPDDEARWLDLTISDTNSLYDMLRPHRKGLLDVYEVSPDVHSPKPDAPYLIEKGHLGEDLDARARI